MGFEERGGVSRVAQDALAWRADRRVHVGAIDQAKDKLGLLRTPHFVEDEDGFHDGAMANIFTADGENFQIVLDNGERLPVGAASYDAEQTVKIFDRHGPVSAADVKAGDYVDYNGRKLLAIEDAKSDLTGERIAKIRFKDAGVIDFFKDDPSARNLTVYREVAI